MGDDRQGFARAAGSCGGVNCVLGSCSCRVIIPYLSIRLRRRRWLYPGRPVQVSPRWDGGYLYNTGTGGVLGNIKVYSPYVSNWSSAWVLLTNKPNATEHHVQAGWDEFPGNVRHYFYEYTTGGQGAGFRVDFTPPTNWINTTHTFEVLYNNYAPGIFSMYIDGSLFGHLASDFVPNADQIYGETHSEADQMAGGIFNKEVLSNEHVWSAGTGWEVANLTPFASNHTWYDTIVVSTTEQEINDTGCSY